MNITEIEIHYSNPSTERISVKKSEEGYEIFKSNWSKKTIELQEELKVVLLNRANDVLGIYSASKGGTSQTTVDIKLIYSVALKCNASAIIVAHNHPSGKLKPSKSDIAITKKLKQAGDYLDIKLLDHLIITKDGYYSLFDNNHFES